MIDEPQLTRLELERLGRSAIVHEPHAPLVHLFPHLESVRDERIDRRMEISTRLRHILDAWHGPLWAPYLAETPATVWIRRRLGYETVGEFLQLAVNAAGVLDETNKTDDTSTESGLPLLDESSRSDDLARWATVWTDLVAASADRQTPPLSAELANAGRAILVADPDAPFQDLFPRLRVFAHERIDDRVNVQRHLNNVLANWHGFRWGDYAAETPASMFRRRNCGLATVGQFAWLAARLMAVQVPSHRRPNGIDPSASADQVKAIEALTAVLTRLSEREHTIVERSILSLDRRDTQVQLGRDCGCSGAYVGQILSRLTHRFRREMGFLNTDIEGLAAALHTEIGAAWPIDRIADVPCLHDPALQDLDRLETRLLLWSAGPFERSDGWIVRRPAHNVILNSRRMLRAAIAAGPVTVSDAVTRLGALGIRAPVAERWIATLHGIEVDAGFVARIRLTDPTRDADLSDGNRYADGINRIRSIGVGTRDIAAATGAKVATVPFWARPTHRPSAKHRARLLDLIAVVASLSR